MSTLFTLLSLDHALEVNASAIRSATKELGVGPEIQPLLANLNESNKQLQAAKAYVLQMRAKREALDELRTLDPSVTAHQPGRAA